MELTYRQVGDYRLPELTLPEEQPEIGKYGRMRKAYLKAHRKALYSTLMTTGKLMTHLAEIEQTAKAMVSRSVQRMAEAEGLTEQMKEANPMRWTGLMNNLKHTAEEQVLNDLIYA